MQAVKSDQGTTLIELLLALALMSLVLAGLFSVYWSGNKVFETESANSNAQYCARSAMQWITQDIRSSYRPEGDSSLDDDEINMSVVKDGQEDAEECHYYLSGTNLYRNSQAIAKNIDYINFTRNAGSALIRVTIEAEVNGYSYRLASSASPRLMLAVNNTSGDEDDDDDEDGDGDDSDWVIGEDGYTGDDQFILTGAAHGGIYVSDDHGHNWQLEKVDGLFLTGLVDMNSIIWNGEELVAVGEGLIWGRIGSSATGENWDDGTPDDLGDLAYWATVASFNGVAWGNGLYVSVANTFLGKGRIFTSTNGDDWDQQKPPGTPLWDHLRPFPNTLNSVVFGNNSFVTVGEAGDIYTSSNGSDWTKRTSGTVADLKSVFWSTSLGKYVAAGENGVILTSSDGISWSSSNSGVANSLNQVVWSQNKYLAVGNSGTILTSGNGTTWNKIVLPDTIDASVRQANITGISSCQRVIVAVVDSSVKVNGKNVLLQSVDGGVTWVQKLVED